MLNRNTTLYKIAGTKFFRLSSGKWPWYMGQQIGTNLQNIEKSMRQIYVPDNYAEELEPKYKQFLENFDLSVFTEEELDYVKCLAQTDQSGAEALIVAYLCRPGNFRDLFLYKIKPHVFVAMHVFAKVWQEKLGATGLDIKFDINTFLKCAVKDLTKLPYWKELDNIIKDSDNWGAKERYYYIAKMICHASNYGMRAGAFQLNVLEKSRGKIILSKQEAERYLTIYHDLFPEIREWHQEVREQVESTKVLYNLFGFPIRFTTKIDETNIKDCFSAVPQSTVGCITNVAYTKLQTYIEDTHSNDVDMLANTHDSYVGQSLLRNYLTFARKQKEYIEQELTNFRGEKFRMRSETGIGFNWNSHSKKNLLGLKQIHFVE